MKREQIVELLNSNIKIQECYNPRRDTCDQWIEGIDKAADAILAMPIDVPSEEEIKKWVNSDKKNLIDFEVWTTAELKERFIGRFEGVKWAINEILKRNKIE